MNTNKYQGNFVVVFNNDEYSLDFLKNISESVYTIKNIEKRSLRVSSYEPGGPSLGYEITETLIKINFGEHPFSEIDTRYADTICDIKGKILWEKSG